jgi:hypothetical protein
MGLYTACTKIQTMNNASRRRSKKNAKKSKISWGRWLSMSASARKTKMKRIKEDLGGEQLIHHFCEIHGLITNNYFNKQREDYNGGKRKCKDCAYYHPLPTPVRTKDYYKRIGHKKELSKGEKNDKS